MIDIFDTAMTRISKKKPLRDGAVFLILYFSELISQSHSN
jgi:hypothetical protein